MGNEKSCSGICCMLSFLIGATVGVSIALLATPKLGKRTREQLERMTREAKERAENYYDEMKDRAAEAAEKVEDYYQEARRTAESTADAAKETFRKATD